MESVAPLSSRRDATASTRGLRPPAPVSGRRGGGIGLDLGRRGRTVGLDAARALALQRAAGNRATQAAISRTAGPRRTLARCPGCGGTCRGPCARPRDESELDDDDRPRPRPARSLTRRRQRGLQRQSSGAAASAPSSISSCRVQFRQGTTRFVDEAQADGCLDQARSYITGAGQRTLTVHGYASVEGDAAFNVDLAYRRAVRVKQLLVQRGVPDADVVIAGHGPRQHLFRPARQSARGDRARRDGRLRT